jgi:hypothetical protein
MSFSLGGYHLEYQLKLSYPEQGFENGSLIPSWQILGQYLKLDHE